MAELEKEIQKLKQRISELESKLDNIQNIVEDIEKDIYLDEEIEEQEDTITCPYFETQTIRKIILWLARLQEHWSQLWMG